VTLCETSCIILAEGVSVSDEIIKTANSKGVNILSSKKNAYVLAKEISELKI
jgi:serine kinase of HPr protein (carbohydrate metabolism regulator)